jgi:hypothetical protein
MGEINAGKILIKSPEGRPRRPRHRWEDILMDLKGQLWFDPQLVRMILICFLPFGLRSQYLTCGFGQFVASHNNIRITIIFIIEDQLKGLKCINLAPKIPLR